MEDYSIYPDTKWIYKSIAEGSDNRTIHIYFDIPVEKGSDEYYTKSIDSRENLERLARDDPRVVDALDKALEYCGKTPLFFDREKNDFEEPMSYSSCRHLIDNLKKYQK